MEQLVSVAVIGVPDDEAGEAIALFATAGPGTGVTPDEVLAVCRRHLPKYMVPRSVLIVDALPVNANGKVAKLRLREMAAAGAAARRSASESTSRIIDLVIAGVTL